MSNPVPVGVRRGLLLVIAAAAPLAVLAGLARVGVEVGWAASRAPVHGPLLVVGVFGTVIGLERAVALGVRWGYAAPAAGAAGAIALVAGAPSGPLVMVASTLLLIAVNIAVVARVAVGFTWLMLLGSIVLAVGTAAWAGGAPLCAVAPAWLTFFVLTIVAERLELSRLAPVPAWARVAVVGLGLIAAILAVAALRGASARGLGAVLGLLALWQLRFDLARRTVRRAGLPRFAALAILSGSAWLLAAGILVAAAGLPAAGPVYDAALHAVLVGFVLAMVMAHAPIILPAVARVAVPFHPVLYTPLVVLHGGLVARIAGDLAGSAGLRQGGAIGNAVALGLLPLAIVAARRLRRSP